MIGAVNVTTVYWITKLTILSERLCLNNNEPII